MTIFGNFKEFGVIFIVPPYVEINVGMVDLKTNILINKVETDSMNTYCITK